MDWKDIDFEWLTSDLVESIRKQIEDLLIEYRDMRLSVLNNNGLCVKEKDGTPSPIIRFSTAQAIGMILKMAVASGELVPRSRLEHSGWRYIDDGAVRGLTGGVIDPSEVEPLYRILPAPEGAESHG